MMPSWLPALLGLEEPCALYYSPIYRDNNGKKKMELLYSILGLCKDYGVYIGVMWGVMEKNMEIAI